MQAVLGWLYSCPTSFTLLAKQSIWSWEINPKSLASLCSNVYNSVRIYPVVMHVLEQSTCMEKLKFYCQIKLRLAFCYIALQHDFDFRWNLATFCRTYNELLLLLCSVRDFYLFFFLVSENFLWNIYCLWVLSLYWNNLNFFCSIFGQLFTDATLFCIYSNNIFTQKCYFILFFFQCILIFKF